MAKRSGPSFSGEWNWDRFTFAGLGGPGNGKTGKTGNRSTI
jgi:hypothetical protein